MSSNTTTNTPSSAAKRGAARKPKLAPLPALIPLPDTESPLFWPVVALNDDAKVQALQALFSAAVKQAPSAGNHTTRTALIRATFNEESNTASAFLSARDEGVLLYAWRGSKALVQSLPASLLAKHSATHTATPAQQVAA